MGIPKLERLLWNTEGCVVDVSIPELVKKHGKNTIVVDGFQFYGQYVYPKFDWVCGSFRDLVQDVRIFVEAFQRIGVKLVFFFVEGNLDEGADSPGSRTWMERQSEFVMYSQKIINALSKPRTLQNLKNDRGYYHTPLNAQSVLLFALRHIFHCGVRFVSAGDRCDATAYYASNNDCLALLAQDNFYMFYQGVPRYISLKNLKLNDMTTVQYCPEALARHTNLESLLFPFLVERSMHGASLTTDQKEVLKKIMKQLDESENVDISRKKIGQALSNINKIEEMFNFDIEKPAEVPVASFLCQLLRYKYGFYYLKVQGPLKNWDLIKLKSQELYQSGQMSNRIEQILNLQEYFNECILEDFIDFPPSSAIYEPLRKMIYGILFHEETRSEIVENKQIDDPSNNSSNSTDDQLHPGAQTVWGMKLHEVYPNEQPQNIGIVEWFMTKEGCLEKHEPTIPQRIDPILHPGLLCLWDLNNETHAIREKKWQLFASCFSNRLSWQLLQPLPPTLVTPAVVLYYLFKVVPNTFSRRSWKYLEPWEVEVFLAQSVMLPTIRDETLSQITIKKINPRVVKLIAIFMYGCRTVRLLVEACGYPVSEDNLCPLHFFDGKLFHSFYDRAEWRRSAMGLCNSETLPVFEQLKELVCS